MSLTPPRNVRITGTAATVPPVILTAEALDRRLGLPAGESLRITGIRQRHTATTETAAQLAATAVRAALETAGSAWEETDCLACASATMDQALPYNAAMVLAALDPAGRHRVASFDIGASCLSFLQAVDLVSCALAAGRFRQAVIVSADISTFTTDPRNLRENGIFGDGAAAAVVRPAYAEEGETSQILASRSLTLPQGVEFCRIRSGGSRWHRRGADDSHAQALFEMRGRPLFALVARELPGFTSTLLAEAGVPREEVSLLIPHQASRQALDHLPGLTGIPAARTMDIFATHGNQVGASLPSALHHAVASGRLTRGRTALLLGSGAGVSMGGIVLRF